MAELGERSFNIEFVLFARKELVEVNNKQVKFMDEIEKAKVLMIYGHTSMLQSKHEDADQALKESLKMFKILHGAISDGRPINDVYMKNVESYLEQNK